jgi:branched-chain amino acid transport system substrate-binding protein
MYLFRFRLRYCALTALASLLFALYLSACGGSGSASSNAPIEVGWIGPLSGVNAILGHWDTQGIELAIDAQNAKGGIHGRQIHLNKLDDAADPTQSVNDVQRLITQNHIVACFCTPNSGTTLAIEPILTRNKIVQFTPGLAGNLTAKGSTYIFRDTPAGLAFESTLISFLVQQKHFKSFAIITDTTDYGQGEAKYQTDTLQKFGLKPLTVQKYGANDTDFTGQLDTIIATHPQVLLFGGSEVASGLIAKQARRLGFSGQLAGGAAIGTPKFMQVAGADIANGVYFTSAYIDNNKNDQTKAFAAAYQARWKEAPEGHGAKAYDGAQLLLQALNTASPNITGETIATALHGIHNFQGLQGSATYDATGEGFHDTSVGLIKNGQLTPVPAA